MALLLTRARELGPASFSAVAFSCWSLAQNGFGCAIRCNKPESCNKRRAAAPLQADAGRLDSSKGHMCARLARATRVRTPRAAKAQTRAAAKPISSKIG